MEEVMRNPRRVTSKRRGKNALNTVLFLIVVAILVTAVGTAITWGALKLTGHEVKVVSQEVGQITFEPKRYDSPNNGHHTQVDNDPDRFWSIVQQQEDKGHLDNYFVLQVPTQDGTWESQYIVCWHDN